MREALKKLRHLYNQDRVTEWKITAEEIRARQLRQLMSSLSTSQVDVHGVFRRNLGVQNITNVALGKRPKACKPSVNATQHIRW